MCACWGVKRVLRFQGVSYLLFSGALSFSCALCLRFISGNRKALSLVILPYCSIHLPLALLHLPFRTRQRNRDVQPLGGPWAGVSPSRHTARLEVVDEVASQCQSLWEAQGVPPASSPVTQQTSLILPCPFLLVFGLIRHTQTLHRNLLLVQDTRKVIPLVSYPGLLPS